MEPNNSYVNTYTKAIADYFSRKDNLTNEDRATAKCLINSIYGESHTTLKDLHKSVYGMTSMSTDTVFLIRVIYNDPATIAFWSDGTKTIVKAQTGDIFDPEKGLAMVIVKKACGNTGNYYNSFKRWLPKNQVGNEEIIYKPETCEDTVEEDEHYE